MQALSRIPGLSAWANGRASRCWDASDLEQTLHYAGTDCDRALGWRLKLSDPEKLLGGAEDLGITCALIPTTTPAWKLVVATSR